MVYNPYPIPNEKRQTGVLVGISSVKTYGPFPFKIFDVRDVTVFRRPNGDSPFEIDTYVIVQKAGNLGTDFFTVTLIDPDLPSSFQFVVSGDRFEERTAGITTGTVISNPALEKELSKVTISLQEQRRNISRAWKMELGNGTAGTITKGDAGRLLIFDELGNLVPGISVDDLKSLIGQGGAIEVPFFETRTAAALATIKPTLGSVLVGGRTVRADGGGGLYTTTNNGNSDNFTEAGGRTFWRVKDVSTRERLKRDRLVDAPRLVQKQLMELNFGFDNGFDPSTEIWPGSSFAVQAYKIWVEAGVEYAYFFQRCIFGAGNNTATERGRFGKALLKRDGTIGNIIGYSAVLNVGHGQDMGLFRRSGITYIASFFAVTPEHVGDDAGKGVSIVRWRDGIEQTTDDDVTKYQLFGYNGSGHRFAVSKHFTVAVDDAGEKLIGVASRTIDGGRDYYEYDIDVLLASGDTLGLDPERTWRISNVPTMHNLAFQGLQADEDYVYFVWGYYHPFGQQCAQVYKRDDGEYVRTIWTEHVKTVYGRALMQSHPTYGFASQFELEGCCIHKDRLSFVVLETWRAFAGTSVVSFVGRSMACIDADAANGVTGLSISSRSPHNPAVWVEVSEPPNAGAWSADATYTRGKVTRRSKLIWEIGVPTGDPAERALVAGVNNMSPDASLISRSTVPDQVFPYDDTFQVWSWSSATRTYKREFEWAENGYRYFDSRPNADNTNWARMYPSFDGNRAFMSLIGGKTAANAASINIYGATDTPFGDMLRMFTTGSVEKLRVTSSYSQFYRADTGDVLKVSRDGQIGGALYLSGVRLQIAARNGRELALSIGATDDDTPSAKWVVGTDSVFYPFTDGTYNLGKSGNRINNSYFAVAPTVTSDMAEKDNFRTFSETEREAFLSCAALLQVYQLKSAIAEKGVDEARLHTGVPAQLCIAEFESRGLDPWRYGCFGRDQKTELVESAEVVRRPLMGDVHVEVEQVSIIDGVATLQKVTVTEKRQRFAEHPIFDVDGKPVYDEARHRDPVTGEEYVEITHRKHIELLYEDGVEPQYELMPVDGEWTYNVRYTELFAAIISAMLSPSPAE